MNSLLTNVVLHPFSPANLPNLITWVSADYGLLNALGNGADDSQTNIAYLGGVGGTISIVGTYNGKNLYSASTTNPPDPSEGSPYVLWNSSLSRWEAWTTPVFESIGLTGTSSSNTLYPFQATGWTGGESISRLPQFDIPPFDGQTVRKWRNKSGRGGDFNQSTGALQPTYSSTNGITFDGVDDVMTIGGFGLNNNVSATDPLWTVWVGKGTPANKFVWGLNTNANGGLGVELRTDPYWKFDQIGIGGYSQTSSGADTNNHVVLTNYFSNNFGGEIYVDVVRGMPVDVTNNYTIISNMCIGNGRTNGGAATACSVLEFCVGKGNLTQSQILLFSRYAKNKYGIPY